MSRRGFGSLALGLLATATLAACASTGGSTDEAAILEEVPVRFMAMPPIDEAAAGGKTVVRLYTVDESYWPVVEFTAEPDSGPVSVSVVNVPGNFGAQRITAPVDPELWKLAIEDFATLAAQTKGDGGVEMIAVAAGGVPEGTKGALICVPVSWFVVAKDRGVETPGMPAWTSCANRQGAALPGLFGLALHSFEGCEALEPQALDVGGLSRCLAILGERAPAVELANLISAERRTLSPEADDLALVLAHFGPQSQFQVNGAEAVTGPDALKAAWAGLAPGRTLRIGLSTYQGLSADTVEVRGEAFHVVDRDLSGRSLAPADRELWFAPYHQVWVKTVAGWSIQKFAIERPARAYGSDPVAQYLKDHAQ